MTAARREQRRLLGLRRAVHFTMAGAPSPAARLPVVKAGTAPPKVKAS